MKRNQYLVAALIAIGLTVASGAVFGRMSNRWGPSKDSLAAAKKLESFPEEFGNWKLLSSQEMREVVVNELECCGYFSRVYGNQESGETVSVAVILGPSGPTAIHVPEICFSSRDHKIIEPRKSVAIADSDDRFWAMTFERNDLSASLIRVYFAWTTGNHWAATENPRFAFAMYPFLYKVQLANHAPAGTDLEKNDPCRNFLEDFTPVMKGYLVDWSGSR